MHPADPGTAQTCVLGISRPAATYWERRSTLNLPFPSTAPSATEEKNDGH